MQNRLSICIADFLLSQHIINNSEKEIYIYGVKLIISSVINILICTTISLLLKDIVNGIVFFISFSSLRRFTGGFHSKKFYKCNLIFSIIVIVALLCNMFFEKMFENHFVFITIILFTLITIVLFSPVYNENKELDKHERKLFLIKSIIVYLIHILIYFVFIIVSNIKLKIILISDLIVAVMIIWGFLNNRVAMKKQLK